MPKISVIVSVYNAQAFLDRCIISILQQSFPDFELIVVDDCSTDQSALLARQFARNDCRIVLHTHKKNMGLGAGRNNGLAAAGGEYVTFVDGDDFLEPNLFQRMIDASDGGRYDIVETGCQYIDSEDNVQYSYIPTAMKIENLNADPDNFFLFGEWGVTQKLWRRPLFQYDNRFPEGVFWEDTAVIPTLVANAQSLVRIDFVGYNYLQHPTSITHSRSAKHVIDMFRAFDYTMTYLRKRGSLEQYQETMSVIIEKGAEYISDHMRSKNRSNPGRADALILLTKMLLKEYRAGRHIARDLRDASFEAVIARTGGRSPLAVGTIETEFTFLIAQAKDDRYDA